MEKKDDDDDDDGGWEEEEVAVVVKGEEVGEEVNIHSKYSKWRGKRENKTSTGGGQRDKSPEMACPEACTLDPRPQTPDPRPYILNTILRP